MRTYLVAKTVSEKLLLIIHRHKDISKKYIAYEIGMGIKTLNSRMLNNDWRPGEIERLNRKITLPKGVKL